MGPAAHPRARRVQSTSRGTTRRRSSAAAPTGWRRSASDANVANGPALRALRELSRDLRRNNGWAKRGFQAIVNNTSAGASCRRRSPPQRGPRAGGDRALERLGDHDRVRLRRALNFYGLQRLAMDTIVESGEVLVLRSPRRATGSRFRCGSRCSSPTTSTSRARRDVRGRRAGLRRHRVRQAWPSRRVLAVHLTPRRRAGDDVASSSRCARPADRVLHVFRVDRPGQIRGVPWLAPAITR
jgi:capsid protein